MRGQSKKTNETLIQRERKRVEEYLDRFIKKDKKGHVRLTEDNATKIEALIRFNPRYGKTTNEENDKCAMSLIKKLKTDERLYKDGEHIRNIIGRINSENSTRMSTNDMDDLRDIIVGIPKDDLLKMLKNDNGEYELIDILARETKQDKRANFSFATKFCHYMCFYLFDEEKEKKYQDNYSIYDNNVINTISDYRKNKEKIPRYDKESTKESPAQYYKNYQIIIDKILARKHDKISRNAFDHILWYCLKIGESRKAKKESQTISKGKKKSPFLSQPSPKRKKALAVIILDSNNKQSLGPIKKKTDIQGKTNQ